MDRPVWFEMQPHVLMYLDPKDLGPREILQTDHYEDNSMAMLRESLGPGKTFVDVGANFGVYSLVLAKTGARVLAIEPNPNSVKRLRKNIAMSRAAIEVYPVACGSKVGKLPLFVAPENNTGMSSLSYQNASGAGTVGEEDMVSVLPLDVILHGTRADAIKIDVEGAELEVLKGARKTLETWHPRLVIEIIENQLEAMGASGQKIRDYLFALDYREGRHDLERNVEFVLDVPPKPFVPWLPATPGVPTVPREPEGPIGPQPQSGGAK